MFVSSRYHSVRLTALCYLGLAALMYRSNVASAQTPAVSPVPPKAKITVKQAEASAVKKIPGKVVSCKYEFEDGRYQYAVLVTGKKGQMYEVEVNSTSGKVTDTEKTSMAEEAKEAAADKKKAAGTASAFPSVHGQKDSDDEKDDKDGK